MLDRFPLVVNDFKGINLKGYDFFNSLNSLDRIEIDEALAQINLIQMHGGDLTTRLGFEKYVDGDDVTVPFTITGQIVQFWPINDLGGVTYTDRWLILSYSATTGNGYLYDTGSDGVATTNPILTLAGMKYAFVLNAFGRMYITPWEDVLTPLTSEYVYVYNGDYNARLTGFNYVLPGAFAAAAAAGGNCTPGLHIYHVVFETDSGYISPPTTAGVLTVTTTSANATINFTAIPTPANQGVIARHILLSKIVVNNNGQGFDSYEPFYAVTINDNTTTTASFTKPDSSLVESAKDRLRSLNQQNIPACVSLSTYGTRMVYNGFGLVFARADLAGYALRNIVAFSEPNNPETVFKPSIGDSNSILVGPEASGRVTVGVEINKTYYVFKEDSTWAINEDLNLSPVEWQDPELVDASKGAYPFSIASVADNNVKLFNDGIVVLGAQGISYFNGRHTQLSLTDKVWPNFVSQSYTTLAFSQLVIDPTRKLAFWRYGDPLDDPQDNCYVFNYIDGFNSDNVKISTFDNVEPGTYGAETISGKFRWLGLRGGFSDGTVGPTSIFDSNHYLLVIPHSAGSKTTANNKVKLFSEALVKADGETTADSGATAIAWVLNTGFTPNQSGELYTFSAFRLRGRLLYDGSIDNPGTGLVELRYAKLDSTATVVTSSIDIKDNIGKYVTQKFGQGVVAEKLRFRIAGSGKVYLIKLVVIATTRAQDRPR